jgi:hypothetical protein
MNMSPVHGSCLCGLVRFEMKGPLNHASHCHCSRCRKHHGAAFATYVGADIAGFRYLSGAERVRQFGSSTAWSRSFCPVCASVLPTLMPEYHMAMSPAGILDGTPDIHPEMHMFAASRAPWYQFTDDLPRYDGYPPDMTPPEAPALKPALPSRVPAAAGVTRGSCLCGTVTYLFEGAPRRMLNCHCSRCRKARSAAYTTNLFVKHADFRFTSGQEQVQDFPLPGTQYFGVAFCRECGSDVPRCSVARGGVVIPAAGLDDDPGVGPTAHIFTGSKANWFEITDRLPQYPELPPA